jgi:hypothetical protein
VAARIAAADKEAEMIGCIALGIVMLIWILTWDVEDGVELSSDPGGGQDPRPAH